MRSLAFANSSAVQHPLQSRLKQSDGTRSNSKLTMMRKIFGIEAPMRAMTEREATAHSICGDESQDTQPLRFHALCV
ncbi:hypothetical protein V8E36_008575 [Tilletia maclaganii]